MAQSQTYLNVWMHHNTYACQGPGELLDLYVSDIAGDTIEGNTTEKCKSKYIHLLGIYLFFPRILNDSYGKLCLSNTSVCNFKNFWLVCNRLQLAISGNSQSVADSNYQKQIIGS